MLKVDTLITWRNASTIFTQCDVFLILKMSLGVKYELFLHECWNYPTMGEWETEHTEVMYDLNNDRWYFGIIS